MTTFGIYEAGRGEGDYEAVVVLGYCDVAGQPLQATLLPHERAAECAYVRVQRNAGAGAVHLVESRLLHAGELGSCDVVIRGFDEAPELVCLTCWTRTGPVPMLASYERADRQWHAKRVDS